MKRLTIVVPAHNEGAAMKKIAGHLISSPVAQLADFIFVVDGCTETKEAIERAIPARSGAKLLFFEKSLGKGRAVWEGFSASRTEYVGFLDADDSISTEDVEKMCRLLIEGKKDCLIASRTKIHGRGAFRSFSSRAFNSLVRLLFPLPFPDTQCGFKLFRKSLLGSEPPAIEGYSFDVELLLRVLKNGGKIETYQLESTERKRGKFSLLSAPSMLLDLLRLRLSS